MSHVRELTADAFADHPSQRGPIKPFLLSHGTLAVKNIASTRHFYEDFLGLQCVQHSPMSMVLRLGMKFHVVCIQLGERAPPAGLHNHWGLDVTSIEEVDAAHREAVARKDEFGLKSITQPLLQHGIYSFYIEDLDSNFWEIEYAPGFQDDDVFDFGDRFTADGKPISRWPWQTDGTA